MTLAMTMQVVNPVHWKFTVYQQGDEATLNLDAQVDEPWHMYSQYLEDGGPVATSFHFDESEHYELIDKVNEGKSVKHYDPNFKMDLAYFEGDCSFDQKIKVKSKEDFAIKGWLEFMVCNDKECLPPESVDFEFDVRGLNSKSKEESNSGMNDHDQMESNGETSSDHSEIETDEKTGENGIKNPVKWSFSSSKIDGKEI